MISTIIWHLYCILGSYMQFSINFEEVIWIIYVKIAELLYCRKALHNLYSVLAHGYHTMIFQDPISVYQPNIVHISLKSGSYCLYGSRVSQFGVLDNSLQVWWVFRKENFLPNGIWEAILRRTLDNHLKSKVLIDQNIDSSSLWTHLITD